MYIYFTFVLFLLSFLTSFIPLKDIFKNPTYFHSFIFKNSKKRIRNPKQWKASMEYFMVWKETFFAKQKSNFLSYNILLRQIFFREHKSSHHFSVLYHHYLAHWKVSLFSIYLFIYLKCVCVYMSLKEFLHVSKTYIVCYLWTFKTIYISTTTQKQH